MEEQSEKENKSTHAKKKDIMNKKEEEEGEESFFDGLDLLWLVWIWFRFFFLVADYAIIERVK